MLQPVAPGVRYVFVKPKGAKVVVDQGLPVNVMAAEEQLRKQTGWLYNKLSFLDHSGTSMTSEDLQKYLEERVAVINHVEVTVTVSPQDRGFSSFSQAEGLDYLNLSSSYVSWRYWEISVPSQCIMTLLVKIRSALQFWEFKKKRTLSCSLEPFCPCQ